ncbi:MAG: cytidine deaminase [Patescibacteria group bacterium]|jgi:cytidine deaminase
MSITNEELIKKALVVARRHKISKSVSSGDVGCALVTDKNHIYVGSNITADCGIGFCAEHSAIAAMVTNHEFKIKKIVAVNYKNHILPPCGRCRELLFQINDHNLNTVIILGAKKTTKLKELLPDIWQKKF